MPSKPRLIQVLCGPRRHCIVASPYEGRDRKEMMTEVRGKLDRLLEAGGIDPWCGICGAKKDTWIFEDRELAFETLAEAMITLKRLEKEQAETAECFRKN